MARVSVLVEPAEAATERGLRRLLSPQWLIPLGYLLLAFAMTWQLWPDPAGRVPTTDYGISNDVFLSTWSLRYVATAISHGHLPALVTTALNAPHGVNLMWNTSLLLPAIVLTPVTLLAGPTASLAILLTLGYAGSAAAMYFVLRRWGASAAAGALAGLIYGFSPAMRVAAEAHYHLQFAVLPPLIIDLALRLATGRVRPVRAGIWLGLLVAAQLFIAEELLVDTAIAGALILLVMLICRPRLVRLEWVKSTAIGVVIAAAVSVLICIHALLVQFRGPLTEVGSPWHVSRYGNQPADFVVASDGMMLHGSGYLAFLLHTQQRLVEYFGYLGWPILIVLAAAAIAFWRDLRVRTAAITFALLELFSIGGHPVQLGPWHIPAHVLPWYWVQNATIVGQVLPNRLSLMADGMAAALLAFAADRAWAAAKAMPDWRKPALAGTAATAIAAALLPVLPQTMDVASVPAVPTGWRAVVADLHLKRSNPLLVFPVNGAMTMEIQAITNGDYSIDGGYCITPDWQGHAASCETKSTLTDRQQTTLLRIDKLAQGLPADRYAPSGLTLELAVKRWRAAAVMITSGASSVLGRYLIQYLGPPTSQHANILGWRLAPGWQTRPQPKTKPAGTPSPSASAAGASSPPAG